MRRQFFDQTISRLCAKTWKKIRDLPLPAELSDEKRLD